MKYGKYYLTMAGILMAGIGITYLLYLFSQKSKVLFVVFAVLTIIILLFIFLSDRFREKAKISSSKEVIGIYIRRGIIAVIVLTGIFLLAVITRSIFMFAGV